MKFEFEYKKSWGNKRFYAISKDAKVLQKIVDADSITDWQIRFMIESGWDLNVCYTDEFGAKINITEDNLKKLVAIV